MPWPGRLPVSSSANLRRGNLHKKKQIYCHPYFFFGASHWTESFPFQHNPTQPGPGAESVCRSSPNGPALWGAHSLHFSRVSSEIPRHFWWDYHELAVHFRWFLASAVLMCFFKHVKRLHTLVKTFYIGLREKTIEMQTNQRRTERTRHTKDNHK